ncbi:MAG: hypothetical protein ACFBSF_17900 [Leptolyngbyaceae cyanobacterium]
MVSFQIGQIDVKTGSDLHETVGGNPQPQFKEVEHSYLEHWLHTHQINTQFFTGKFYDQVNDADRQRLEADGKVLVFTNGKNGYFTDPDTAKLMTEGDAEQGISPLYANDINSPHNTVAYGSLLASDGMASTNVERARILVIDDEQRSHGDEPLLDKQGQPIPPAQLEKLYDKMGDGTMLVTPKTMRDLITPEEHEALTAKAFQKADISTDLTTIAEELTQMNSAIAAVEKQVDALASRTVTQFRAATPDLPGMIKGTMASSRWCERLGVDAIISTNDIKGDDGRLSTPGIQEVSQLWVNRKSDGQYGQQAVGPQVKGCIPEATQHEFNPRIEAQAQALAAVAGDPIQLKDYYLQQKERQRDRPQTTDESIEAPQAQRSEWLYDTLKADKFNQFVGFSKVNKGLERHLKGQWQDTVLRGIHVPSAMAQHHSQLKPWEVCNKDLPHGSIVAYYRSPFPNVGAAAIAINNTDIIRQQDREAFSKNGVAYLSPWTAKHIAITDFDRDANGYFEGYQATVPDLPQQLRQQLASVEALPPAQQYEAGRAAIAQLIQGQEQGQEDRITPAEYPLAVKEFVEKNAPDQKPPDIVKQKKVKHPWQEGESHAAATWRAWGITADNPTGKVANAGMTLQSLALEMTHTPPAQQERLLRQVSTHFAKQLKQANAGKLTIPDDDGLESQGFPRYQFKSRMKQIAEAKTVIPALSDPQKRKQYVEQSLQAAAKLLSDAVNGPNAVNLQTAVDTAKSSRGIDESHHAFIRGLAYKDHELRQHQKDPNNYVNGQLMPTNTQEPIGWGVEAVNAVYKDVHLPELRNEAFRDLFPKTATLGQAGEALGIARTYNERIANYQAAKTRLRENRPEDQQPALQVTSPSGRQLTIQTLKDPEGVLPIWRANDQQPDWEIAVKRNPRAQSKATQFSAALSFTDTNGDRRTETLGDVAPESATEHHLAQRLQQLPHQTLTIQNPHAQIQAPYAQQNDADEILIRATSAVERSIAHIPKEERPAYLSALWRQSEGMGLALKHFAPEISDRLQSVPEITLTGIQQSINEVGPIAPGDYTVRFSEYSYQKAGQTKTTASVAIVGDDGSEQQFGAISARSVHLPLGTTVKAHLEINESGKSAQMRVLDLAETEGVAPATASAQMLPFPASVEQPKAAEAPATYEASDPHQTYAPSRQELRQWCAVAIANDDKPLTDNIIAKGQQLNERYTAETGNTEKPPLDYRHSAVVISERDRKEMHGAIAAAQETLQATASQHRIHHAQTEIG